MTPPPQGDSNEVKEVAGVEKVLVAPAPEPAPPSLPPPPPAAEPEAGTISLEQFVAEMPSRAVLAAALTAYRPDLRTALQTEEAWAQALQDEAERPIDPPDEA